MRRSFCNMLTIAATLAMIVGWGGTGRAQTYEWEYSINGGAFTAPMNLLTGSNTPTDATASASPSGFGGNLTISISTASNNPGASNGSFLFNATTNVANNTASTVTVAVEVTETGFSMPTGPGNLNGTVGSVTVFQTNEFGNSATATFSNTWGALDPGNGAFTPTNQTNSYGAGPLTASGGATTNGPDGTLSYSGNPFTAGSSYSMTVANTVQVSSNATSTDKVNLTYTPSGTSGVVPEPSTMALAGLGALGLIGYGLRRRKALGT